MDLPRNARSESGFALIEVVVSAAVLAIVAMAVLSGIDAASGSSAREKARAVAVALAEADQERMRGMSVETLLALPLTTTVPVEKATYTVKSKAEWVTDDTGGTPSCGNSSDNNQYLHVTSTVTSTIVGLRVKEVKIDSLIAPSVAYSATHGTLGVKVVNRSGVGVKDITVGVANAAPLYAPPAADTDAAGCVLFRTAPIGTYAIKLNEPNFVDPDGNLEGLGTQKVSPGVVTFKTLEYDKATTASVTVKTKTPGTTSTLQTSKASVVSATNATRTSLLRNFVNAVPVSTLTAPRLYPFKDTAYGFFTGRCAYESPDKLGNPTYFGDNPTSGVTADPAVAQPQGVTAVQPPFNIRIDKNYNDVALGATPDVVIAATLQKPAAFATDPCVEPKVMMTVKAWPATGWGTAPGGLAASYWVVQNDGVAAQFDPGMPFGTYTVCIVDRAPSTDRYTTFTYINTVPGGATTTKSIVKASWSTTACAT